MARLMVAKLARIACGQQGGGVVEEGERRVDEGTQHHGAALDHSQKTIASLGEPLDCLHSQQASRLSTLSAAGSFLSRGGTAPFASLFDASAAAAAAAALREATEA